MRPTSPMKKYFASFIVAFTFLAAFASGQTAPQEPAPRKADAQFVSDYDAAKKISTDIAEEQNRAIEQLTKKLRPKQVQLEGLTVLLQRRMASACADVPQGCRYEETLHVFVPLPKVQPPPAAPAPAPSAPAEAPKPAAPAEEKK